MPWDTGVLGWRGFVGKGPIGRCTTRTVPVGGLGRLSSYLQSKGVPPGKLKMKADTMNRLAGTTQMLANPSSLDTSPLTHTVKLSTRNSWWNILILQDCGRAHEWHTFL